MKISQTSSVNVQWDKAGTLWRVTPASELEAGRGRRSAASGVVADLPKEFTASTDVIATESFYLEPTVQSAQMRRGTVANELTFRVETAKGERCVVALRHPSGAISFHAPIAGSPARRGIVKQSAEFAIPIRNGTLSDGGSRRGVVGMAIKKLLKVTVIKVVDLAVTAVLSVLGAKWEKAAWKRHGLTEGWLRVTRDTLQSGALTAWTPTAATLGAGRSLLLIHGTFSDTHGCYKQLAESDFFDRIAHLYGDRIFAFNHLTVSVTPEENARRLLDALPAGRFEFDVITHSRGGLLLRNVVERSAVLGASAQRFALGHAVLVASPNEGTPLATPQRWDDTLGWLANLLDFFPDNPFTTGASWVAEGLVWLAHHAVGALPGLASMDAGGNQIAELQEPPGPPANAYSALTANFSADEQFWQRMLDAGVDAFFAMPNDLVVPTEGGWRVDKEGEAYIPAERIGCFGPGGNLRASTGIAVQHINFFSQPETVEFLVRALSRQPSPLPRIDAQRPLPDRRSMRSATVVGAASATPPVPAAVAQATPEPIVAPPVKSPAAKPAPPAPPSLMTELGGTPLAPDTFFLMIFATSEGSAGAKILAQYGNARVVEDFVVKGQTNDAGRRWHDIIAMHERIRGYIDGIAPHTLPGDQELISYGTLLFESLFPPSVRRLYDVARTQRGGERLDFIFTTTIPWVADKPWEFAHDPERGAFLATQEVHFIRNVVSAVPAEPIVPHEPPLRLLVVGAQPVGLGRLSVEEETTVIRRGFEPLIEAGLVDVTVLPRATPISFHGYLATGHFDVVHFIGHGEFDDNGRGALLFENGQGDAQRLDHRTMRELFCQRGIRLVFLNACESARGGKQNFNTGAAPAIAAGGVPAVVANQFKVLDSSATAFAQFFYWCLAQGMSVGRAVREARIAVNYSLSGESIDWAVPVLYAQDSRSRLCRPLGGASQPAIAPVTTMARRRAVAGHATRIGIWDVSDAFPGLEDLLAVLNQAQQHFGFEITDTSVPFGTWQMRQRNVGDEKVAYLYANPVAQKLKRKPRELGLDAIFCLTTHPMMADAGDESVVENLYAWWEDRTLPIMFFSSADLDLPVRGPLTNKVLTNSLAQCLTGMLTGGECHLRGPKSCPLYYNPERSLALMAADRKFDPECRGVLAQKIPNELPAIEALLRAVAAPPGSQPADDEPVTSAGVIQPRKAKKLGLKKPRRQSSRRRK